MTVRRLVFSLMGLVLLGAALAPTTEANTVQADCSNFGSQLTAAGAGDTIVLTGMCSGSNAHFIMPPTANLTIEGAAGGTNGFDGTGLPAATSALTSPAAGNNGFTAENLTFQNYPAAALRISTNTAVDLTNQFVFANDKFTNNSSTGGSGGGLGLDAATGAGHTCTAPAPTVTLSGSAFTGNQVNFQGAGAMLDLECTAGSASMSVTNNTFSNNAIRPATNGFGQGGGLSLGTLGRHSSSNVPVSLTESGNVFDGNSILGTGGGYSGGGEFTVGADITSNSDRFTNNTISGPSTSIRSSEGGGLATRSGGGCTNIPGSTSQATNLVVAGNTIGAPSGTGTSASAEGAGIYAGCVTGTGGYNLTLLNSTVSGNQAPAGGVAGVDGEATDILNLQNTILAGNLGGSDLGGFGASDGANATAASSDVCAIGSATPFAGSGNLCADPLLAGPGPGTGDAHETNSSPTLDAGSNSLVTAATDVFGVPRILPSKPNDQAIVDIGAAEFVLPDNGFMIGKVKGKTLFVTVNSPGEVDVVQNTGKGRGATVSAKKHKKKLLKKSKGSGGPGTVKVKLKLTGLAKRRLKASHKLKIPAKVTFTPTDGSSNTKTAKLKLKTKRKRHH